MQKDGLEGLNFGCMLSILSQCHGVDSRPSDVKKQTTLGVHLRVMKQLSTSWHEPTVSELAFCLINGQYGER